jgi:ABC-type oligopeptide transport system ATPase subunit
MNNESLLDVRHLRTVFQSSGSLLARYSVVAVDDVSFQLPADKATLLTIVGESGSRKTTLARGLLGLIQPTSGEVCYRGKSIYVMRNGHAAACFLHGDKVFAGAP